MWVSIRGASVTVILDGGPCYYAGMIQMVLSKNQESSIPCLKMCNSRQISCAFFVRIKDQNEDEGENSLKKQVHGWKNLL